MRQTIIKILTISAVIGLVVGFFGPTFFALPAAYAQQPAASSTPIYVQPPDNATPTPTPFQPQPPTPVYLPTDIPQPTSTPEPTLVPTETPIPGLVIDESQLELLPNQINILLLGSDRRSWQKGKRYRTDTIILATLNKDLGTLNLTSFPRDLFLQIPGHGQDRINTAWVYGGYDLLAETFKQNFGVKIDHYVLIDFLNFKRFVDQLDGLEINVGTELSDYRNGYWTTIPAGEVHMDADTILWYVRSRKSTNDFARNKRQQEVIQAIFEEVLTLKNIAQAPQLYEIYKEMVITDLSWGDLLPMVPLVVKLMNPDNVNHYFIGPKHVTDWITPAGAMVLLPNMDSIRNVIRKSQNLQ